MISPENASGIGLQTFRDFWLDAQHDLSPSALAAHRLQPIVVPDVPTEEELRLWCNTAKMQGELDVDAFVYEYQTNQRGRRMPVSFGNMQDFLFGNTGYYRTLITQSKSFIMHCDQSSEYHLIAVHPSALQHFAALLIQANSEWDKLLHSPQTREAERDHITHLLRKYGMPAQHNLAEAQTPNARLGPPQV